VTAQEDAQRTPSRGQVEQAPRPTEEVATGASRPAQEDAQRTPSRGQVEQAPRPTEEIATGTESGEAKPLLKVIDAHATPEEVAAIVTVLSALGGAAPAPKPQRSQWAHPGRRMAPIGASGRGGWRASALPR
jgi:hypothetical protein